MEGSLSWEVVVPTRRDVERVTWIDGQVWLMYRSLPSKKVRKRGCDMCAVQMQSTILNDGQVGSEVADVYEVQPPNHVSGLTAQ